MKQTVVEWLYERLERMIPRTISYDIDKRQYLQQAKEMEKTNTDNKVIHFAEWLTKKHTTVLMTLYEQFEEQYYNETFNTKEK
jgi:hypothetical protein